MPEEKQYAVVTRVKPVREGGRIIVHTYGPYSKGVASRVSQRMKRRAARDGWSHRAEISICTLINKDGMIIE